jgi:Ca-activated chloride channel homolog
LRALGRLSHKEFDRESRQNHRHRVHPDLEHTALRALSVLALTRRGMPLYQEAPYRSHTSSCALLSACASARFRLSLLATLFLLIIGPVTLNAQDGVSRNDDDVLRVRTDLVVLPVIVKDARDRRVQGLLQTDFAVRDNGRAVRLEYFAAGTERVALAFALDASGSVREMLTRQRETALSLFSRFGKDSRVAVLQFSESARFVVPFTTDTDKALAGFDFPAVQNRRTALFDAALAATRAFDVSASDRTERRIIILISDGLDTISKTSAQDVMIEARTRGVSFYLIHLPLFAPRDGQLKPRPPAKNFRALAEQTGGRYFMVGDAKSALDPRAAYDLAPVFQAIEDDLKGQYVVGYYPDAATRAEPNHRIEIKLTSRDKRNLHVQTLREEYTLKQ